MNTSPQSPDDLIKEAIAAHKAGRMADAERIYRDVLAEEPTHPEANHNIGIIVTQRGQTKAGLFHFKTALENEPAKAIFWFSYARALTLAGQPQEAILALQQGRSHGLDGPGYEALLAQAKAAKQGSGIDPSELYRGAAQLHEAGQLPEAIEGYRKVLLVKPDHIDSHEGLGLALSALGKFGDAETVFRGALERYPDAADRMAFHLGNISTEQGDFANAVDHYRRSLNKNPSFPDAHYHLGSVLSETGRVAEGFEHLMRRAALVYGTGRAPAKAKADPLHKTKHDREQREYLKARNVSVPTGAVDDMFHLGDGTRISGHAVNPANATPALLEEWRRSQPQHVIIENFLTAEALEKLRAYCAESTIWRRMYDAGYIGATPPDGFACPLLAQIVEETGATYKDFIAPHVFKYLGAFKYDSELSTGTNTHADFSAVNVNLYIAPEGANLDSETGGMVIWNIEAKDEAEMRRFNSDENALRAHIKKTAAPMTRIPHRANRAVIFKSSFYHRTDDCTFAEGYLNKRINVSLLYGAFGGKTR